MKRSWRWTLKKIAQRIRDGFGQGVLSEYVPWIGVRDISSQGTSTRMWSPKTGRKMQFLSNIERDTFLIAEFREDFVDYWEQWPLDRNWTQWAARRLGYRHPIYIGSTIPVVMTVDAVLTRRTTTDCKHSDSLAHPRTSEKLAIARLACERVGLQHILVTEKANRKQLVHNILWVRMALPRSGEKLPLPGAFDLWPMRLHKHLLKSQLDHSIRHMTAGDYCRWFERSFALPPGLGLRCMKLLMWQHLVELDMEAPHPERTPVCHLRVRPSPGFALPSSQPGDDDDEPLETTSSELRVDHD
jgi:TnsA endonuclease N terminal